MAGQAQQGLLLSLQITHPPADQTRCRSWVLAREPLQSLSHQLAGSPLLHCPQAYHSPAEAARHTARRPYCHDRPAADACCPAPTCETGTDTEVQLVRLGIDVNIQKHAAQGTVNVSPPLQVSTV